MNKNKIIIICSLAGLGLCLIGMGMKINLEKPKQNIKTENEIIQTEQNSDDETSDLELNIEDSNTPSLKDLQDEIKNIKKEEQKELTEISVKKFERLYEGKKVSIVYLSNPTCEYCNLENTIIKHVKYKYPELKIYYVNTDKLSEDNNLKAVEVPITMLVKNNEIIDSFGTTDVVKGETGLIKFFQNNSMLHK